MVENKLRKLCTKDLFPMFGILSKIGLKEFKECFNVKSKKNNATEIGIGVSFDIADIIFKNIGKCETDIYNFFANLSGKKPQEMPELDLAEFAEMVSEFSQKAELRDFFMAVLKLAAKVK